ncbi:MAG: lytic transglycosylase domain-containing protein [Acidobacteriota bacterium]|nr:lytic transglycosylase domain-containing protein [Acidobacteriota bacterium]
MPDPGQPAPAPAPVPALSAAAGPAPYDTIVQQVAARQGVDAGLVRAMIAVESDWQPGATSPKGAMGLMQLMPETARQYHLANPYDPRANIEAGVRHLKALLTRYSLRLALAAYNAGEAAVARFGGIPPYPETRDYVTRVLARAQR